jgi:hypothetical protein
MPNPLSGLGGKHLVPRLKQQIFGLAEDFWTDGPENLLGLYSVSIPIPKIRPIVKPPPAKPQAPVHSPPRAADGPIWRAEPGEISEKMWGEGFVTPGGQLIDGMLVAPLGLMKEMSVLDLSAGLGERMRDIVKEAGVYITGLEPDAPIAERGMRMSLKAGEGKHAPIAHYDPAHLKLDRHYNCFIARETFYRVPNRPSFFAILGEHAKPQAQAAFTDYIVDPEYREHPAILAWRKNEILANPMGLVETAEIWAKIGFDLRVHEDLTDFYKAEIMVGLKRLKDFLASGARPDKETGAAVLRRLDTWKYRLAAMDAGMKFYRFYGMKN